MAGVLLKDAKGRIDIVSSSVLEEKLMNTIIGGYVDEMYKYFWDQINDSGKVSFPTLQKFFELCPKYYTDMIDLYRLKMSDMAISCVDVDTMVSQAALFDGLCFVYDSFKDSYCLATMNFELLYDFEIEYDMLNQVLAKNNSGYIKAYRIDVEYLNNKYEFNFKAVNARDFDIDDNIPDTDVNKRFFIVPYHFCIVFMRIIESLLREGNTLRVHQALSGVEKVRFISNDLKLLSDMCDVPDAVVDAEARYFPLKGFFYAPVVGAPSTSAMVTNINVFDVFKIKKATELDYKRFNVHKSENPVKHMIAEGMVIHKLMDIKDMDIDNFACILDMFPYRYKFLSDDIDDISEFSLSKYLHSIPDRAKDKIYEILDLDVEVYRISKALDEGKLLSKEDIENIDNVLKEGICKLVIQKKDCNLGSILCTNNKAVLMCIYGNDYIRKYEGFSTKYYEFLSWIRDFFVLDEENIGDSRHNIELELNYVGLPSDSDTIDAVVGAVRVSGKDIKCTTYKMLKNYFAEIVGVDSERSSFQSEVNQQFKKEGMVLARSLDAYINDELGPVDYYKRVDRDKIVKGVLFKWKYLGA